MCKTCRDQSYYNSKNKMAKRYEYCDGNSEIILIKTNTNIILYWRWLVIKFKLDDHCYIIISYDHLYYVHPYLCEWI